jgi:hypothetical protein
MKQIGWTLCLMLCVSIASAQTKTTEALDKDSDGLSLYFYKNTLRMLNQAESKEFDDMIKDIEKMRFLLIDRIEEDFGQKELSNLKSRYKGEAFEEVMSSRLDGRNFEVYVRESDGDIKGTVVLASDSTQLFVLDILGKIAIAKVPEFFNSLDDNTDIGKKIKEFMDIADH